jgi:hypothetical protein
MTTDPPPAGAGDKSGLGCITGSVRVALRWAKFSELGIGSCVTSIAGPNAMRNCTRDEGRPLEFGNPHRLRGA